MLFDFSKVLHHLKKVIIPFKTCAIINPMRYSKDDDDKNEQLPSNSRTIHEFMFEKCGYQSQQEGTKYLGSEIYRKIVAGSGNEFNEDVRTV